MARQATTDEFVEIILLNPGELVYWDRQLLDDVAEVLRARRREREEPDLYCPISAYFTLACAAALASMTSRSMSRADAPAVDAPNTRAWLAWVMPEPPSSEAILSAADRLKEIRKRKTRRDLLQSP
ncbi:hypothetical protein LCM28_09915 [Salipiger pacificus]|nr:hypothetical protein [Alloyangia pacifica]